MRQKRISRTIFLTMIVVALAVGGGVWLMRQMADKEPQDIVEEETEESSETTDFTYEPDELLLPGTIEPLDTVPVSPEITASIARMLVDDGQVVSAGQTLCTLDDSEIRQQIQSAEAALLRQQETVGQLLLSRAHQEERANQRIREAEIALEQARQDLRELEDTANMGGSPTQIAQSERAVRNAELRLAQAQEDLRDFDERESLELKPYRDAAQRAREEAEEYEGLYEVKAVSLYDLQERRRTLEDALTSLQQAETNHSEQRQELVRALEDADRAYEEAQQDILLTKQEVTPQQLRLARNRVTSAEERLRVERLTIEEERITEREIEAARRELSAAEAELRRRRERLKGIVIRAPMSGTVRFLAFQSTGSAGQSSISAQSLGAGVTVREGVPFLEISSRDASVVKVEVDEIDVGRLQLGMPATITGDAFADRTLQGQILEIASRGTVSGEGVTNFAVTVLITSPLEGIRLGMNADVSISLEDTEETEDATATDTNGQEPGGEE